MKVLYLLRYYPTLTETFIHQEIAGMAALGHEVQIARLGQRPDGRLAEELPQVPVHDIPRRSLRGLVPFSAAQRQVAAWQRPKDAARLGPLRHLARGFDRVHVHFAGEAAELAWALKQDLGLPYGVMVHAVDLFVPRPSLRQVLGEADSVLTVARFHQQRLAEQGIDAGLLRCGPDLAAWARLPPPPPGPLRALFVGRDQPKKGLDDLLAAWAMRQGAGDLTLITDRMVPAGPGLRPLGLLGRGALRAELTRANLLVLPCRVGPDGDQDGVPLVIMEALAAGRPVLTTPVSGIPELVDAEVGWLCDPGDPAALATSLQEAEDPHQRRIRGERGPERLRQRQFTLAAQVRGLDLEWRACLAAAACGSAKTRT